MHFHEKPVAAMIFSILHDPLQSAFMNKILHIS